MSSMASAARSASVYLWAAGLSVGAGEPKVLCQPSKPVVDGFSRVRVVLPHHLADRLRRLLVLAVRAQPLLVHPVDDPALHGLEAVPRVGKGARGDDRHRGVQEGAFHLLLDLDGLDVAFECLLAVVRHGRQMSRNRTSLAFSWMKWRRVSASSPMSLEKMSSAIAASSTDTWSRFRVARSIVVTLSSSQSISPSPLKRSTSYLRPSCAASKSRSTASSFR